MNQYLARIIANEEVATGHYRLRLEAPEIAATARAGQFVHVLPRVAGVYDPLLRRAFSILSVQDTIFDILFRVQGRGTRSLSSHQSGDSLDIMGPLGVPFFMPDRVLNRSFDAAAVDSIRNQSHALPVQPAATTHVILVGGGVGVPPLAMLAAQIEQARASLSAVNALKAPRVTALIGARSRSDVICVDDLESAGARVEIATDDGSCGTQGLVTQLLEAQLESREREHDLPETVKGAAQIRDGNQALVYACGPLPMLRAVAAICANRAVPCQVSLEENMPCGVGVCNGCVVRVAQADDEYGYYRRVCVDGPVMWAHEVAWDNN